MLRNTCPVLLRINMDWLESSNNVLVNNRASAASDQFGLYLSRLLIGFGLYLACRFSS